MQFQKIKKVVLGLVIIGFFFTFLLYKNLNVENTTFVKKDIFIKKHPKKENPLEAWKQDYELIKNPVTGKPEPEKLIPIREKVQEYLQDAKSFPIAPGSHSSNSWTSLGPNDQGGRTRAIMFDPNDTQKKKVWAGGVTGGLWYNNDITSSTSKWMIVDDFWNSIGVTCIAYDPNNTRIFYVGTGEGFTTRSSSTTKGAGIWKTTDGGSSWSRLSSSVNFKYVNDIVVRNEAGSSVLYVGVDRGYYKGKWDSNNGLYRSTNGGSTFTEVMGRPTSWTRNYSPVCIKLASDNRLWVSTRRNTINRGGGRIFYSDDGTTWTQSYSVDNDISRVAIAVAPTDANYVYALIEENSRLSKVIYTSNKGGNWTEVAEPQDADTSISNDDFTRGQGWYNLVIQVSPTDKNTIIAGGIDLFRSTNNGRNWTQISKWSNNNNLSALTCSLVHADQHAIVFRPDYPNEVLFGNDGGVYYCSSLSTAHNTNVTGARNKGYVTTQFYTCAISPTLADYLGGTQDNGSWNISRINNEYEIKITGSDGGACFFSKNLVKGKEYAITSYYRNYYNLIYYNGTNWRLSRILSDPRTGSFINIAELDTNLDILYTYKESGKIYRVASINPPSTPVVTTTLDINGITGVTAMRVSPYTKNSTTLLLGDNTGAIVKSTNTNTTPVVTTLSNTGITRASVSSISFGSTEDKILVTYANYGLTKKIFYSTDGGNTWQNKTGNFPDMPIRSALINPYDEDEVILATELGVWKTTSFSNNSPNWTPSNTGFANVRTDMLRMRRSDGKVLAATHGRGLFIGQFKSNTISEPTLTSSNITKNSLRLNWNSVSKAAHYILDISENANFSGFVSGYDGKQITGTTVDVTGLSPATTYYCRLKAVNSAGVESDSSVTEVTTKLSEPLLMVSKVTQNSFKLSWNSVSRAAHYILDISKNNSFSSFVIGYNGKQINGTTVDVTGLSSSTNYYYRLKAVNSSGVESDYSSVGGVILGERSLHTKVKNLLSKEQVSVSPNPASDYLRINLNMNEYKPLEFRLFSLQGKLIYSYSYNKVMNINHTIDVLAVPSGSYILAIYSENTLIYRTKILVKKGTN